MRKIERIGKKKAMLDTDNDEQIYDSRRTSAFIGVTKYQAALFAEHNLVDINEDRTTELELIDTGATE